MAWNLPSALGSRLSARRYAILGTSSEDSKRDRVGRLLSTPRALLAVAILRFPGLPLIYFYNHRSADIFGSDVEVLVFFSLHMWLGGIAFAQVRPPFPNCLLPQDSEDFVCATLPSFEMISCSFWLLLVGKFLQIRSTLFVLVVYVRVVVFVRRASRSLRRCWTTPRSVRSARP